jgi:DNA-binding CsgD family transcriptional regulator/signal transduction histidine kinase
MPDENDTRIDDDQESLIGAIRLSETAAIAVEAERRRLAQSLGTVVIEPLNLLLSQALAYEPTLTGNPQARMVVSVLTSLARQLLQQTRDLQANLHPTILDALGLEPALETLAGQVERSVGLRITLGLERLRQRPSSAVELALYRLAQSCLDRAHQSAGASETALYLHIRESWLIFRYTDNGASNLDSLHESIERVRQLGGRVEILRSDLAKFEVVARFPIEPEIELTARELEVLRLLADGLTNKQIAHALKLSARTVNFHLDNMYSKLGVNSRTQAVVYALRQGWLSK